MNFINFLDEEIEREKNILDDNLRTLRKVPRGSLRMKERKYGLSFYQEFPKDTGPNKMRNVTKNTGQIASLLDKKILENQNLIIQSNLNALMAVRGKLNPFNLEVVISGLAGCYKSALEVVGAREQEKWVEEDYPRCGFDPSKHIHETVSGVYVRSKSEVIIANALTSYQIPFHYEERLDFPDNDGNFYYPDFTIRRPDGRKIIWEHFGLLSNMGYCDSNARKLYLYQKNGLVLYRNLIITQDDKKGNCSSALTDEIIRKQILIHF